MSESEGHFASLLWDIERWIIVTYRRPTTKPIWYQLKNTGLELDRPRARGQVQSQLGSLDWRVMEIGLICDTLREERRLHSQLGPYRRVHPAWNYKNHLRKTKLLCWAARDHLLVLAWLSELEMKWNPGNHLKALKLSAAIDEIIRRKNHMDLCLACSTCPSVISTSERVYCCRKMRQNVQLITVWGYFRRIWCISMNI